MSKDNSKELHTFLKPEEVKILRKTPDETLALPSILEADAEGNVSDEQLAKGLTILVKSDVTFAHSAKIFVLMGEQTGSWFGDSDLYEHITDIQIKCPSERALEFKGKEVELFYMYIHQNTGRESLHVKYKLGTQGK